MSASSVFVFPFFFSLLFFFHISVWAISIDLYACSLILFSSVLSLLRSLSKVLFISITLCVWMCFTSRIYIWLIFSISEMKFPICSFMLFIFSMGILNTLVIVICNCLLRIVPSGHIWIWFYWFLCVSPRLFFLVLLCLEQ